MSNDPRNTAPDLDTSRDSRSEFDANRELSPALPKEDDLDEYRRIIQHGTDVDEIANYAEAQAKEAGCSKSYAIGYLASALASANRTRW